MGRIDPELTRQLDRSSADDIVEMVVHVGPASAGARPLEPEETKQLVEDLVARAGRKTGHTQFDFNVFPYMSSFAISGSPEFIRTLVAEPEVVSAVANRQPEGGLIRPMNKRPASIEDIARRPGQPAKKSASRRSVRAQQPKARQR